MGATDKIKSAITIIEARALISAITLIGSFILLAVFGIFAPEFFQQIYILVFTQMAWVLGYYFGAKNHEKRIEYLINQLITFALRGAAAPRSQSTGIPPR